MAQANIPSAQETVINDDKKFTSVWVRYMFELWKRVNGGALFNLGGRLTTITAAKGNVAGGEDDLISYILPKNTLQNNGDILEIIAYGTTAANADGKTIKLIFGATTLFDTGSIDFNSSAWCIRCEITCISNTALQAIATFQGDFALLTSTSTFTDVTENLTTPLTIKCTGASASSETDDIIQKGLTIKMFPAG